MSEIDRIIAALNRMDDLAQRHTRVFAETQADLFPRPKPRLLRLASARKSIPKDVVTETKKTFPQATIHLVKNGK